MSDGKLSLDLSANADEDYQFALSPPRTPPPVKFSDMDVEDDTIDNQTKFSPRRDVSLNESDDEGFLTRNSGTNFKLPEDVTRTPPESPVRRGGPPPSIDVPAAAANAKEPLSVTFPSTPNHDSAPASPSTPAKRVIVLSDMVALNHMPSVRNPAKLTHELELSDMWEIIGSAFVKHNGIRSLLLELASPLHLKDLPLLTRWARAKLNNEEVEATWATQAQIFEMNALKKQSRRRQRAPRTRPRVYKTPEPRLSMPSSNYGASRPRVPPMPHLQLPRSKSLGSTPEDTPDPPIISYQQFPNPYQQSPQHDRRGSALANQPDLRRLMDPWATINESRESSPSAGSQHDIFPTPPSPRQSGDSASLPAGNLDYQFSSVAWRTRHSLPADGYHGGHRVTRSAPGSPRKRQHGREGSAPPPDLGQGRSHSVHNSPRSPQGRPQPRAQSNGRVTPPYRAKSPRFSFQGNFDTTASLSPHGRPVNGRGFEYPASPRAPAHPRSHNEYAQQSMPMQGGWASIPSPHSPRQPVMPQGPGPPQVHHHPSHPQSQHFHLHQHQHNWAPPNGWGGPSGRQSPGPPRGYHAGAGAQHGPAFAFGPPPGKQRRKPGKRRRRPKRSKRSKRRQKANRVNRAQRMMPIKCLFLDIEGVLTTQAEGPSALPRSIRKITPKLAEKLLMLKLVVYLTRCKLICTCSIKTNHKLIETVNVIFKAWGIMPFYSVTSGLPEDRGDGPLRLLPSNRRAREVGHWLRSRNVKTWCVVDMMDLSVLDDECDRTVMVDGLQGMSRDDCKQILDILGVEPELYH